jgi:CRISPR-associated endonuclease/helicase Cas3
VVVVPLPERGFDPAVMPDPALARLWSMQSMSLSRPGVVRQLQAMGVPPGWGKSPLLRNAYPLLLDAQGCWVGDRNVHIADDLGLVYESKETT